MPASLRSSMQINKSWLHGSPLSHIRQIFQPCLCLCLSLLAACGSSLRSGSLWSLLRSSMGIRGWGSGFPPGESQTLQHSRESSVFPVVSHTANKCFIVIALFVIQLLRALIPPIRQREMLLSELHTFIATHMRNSHSRNSAVIL